MPDTHALDIRRLLDELEEPLILVDGLVNEEDPAEDFDGVCTQHDGCRSIL